MMYHVMIIEDDPMVASINRQYVEATPPRSRQTASLKAALRLWNT